MSIARVSIIAASFLVLAAATSAVPTANPADRTDGLPAPASDSASAHRAAEEFLSAFDSLQFERFSAYLAEDVTMFFPFPQLPARVDGRARVAEIFGQFMTASRAARARDGRPMVQGLKPRDLRLQMAGAEVAVVSFHLGPDSRGRRSIVFRKDGDEWRVIHWHASVNPPPADG